MRWASFCHIIVAVVTKYNSEDKEAASGRMGPAASDCPASATVSVAICGDPVVGRVLTLLLPPTRYEARFVPLGDSSEPEPLEGARLVLLTPTPGLSAARRETLVGALREWAVATGKPVMELAIPWMRTETEHWRVPWPCSTEELERRIEEALSASAGTHG